VFLPRRAGLEVPAEVPNTLELELVEAA
jgi:hypothetical protein